MRNVLSTRIADLLLSAVKVETEIEKHAAAVVAILNSELLPPAGTLEVEEPPNFLGYLQALKARLAASRQALNEAESSHSTLVRQAVGLRTEREELRRTLSAAFSSIRRLMKELYEGSATGPGSSVFVVAGFEGPTKEQPDRLLRQVDRAVKALSRPELTLPPSRIPGSGVEPAELVGLLAPTAAELARVQDALRGVVAEMKASRKVKNRALRDLSSTYIWVGRGVESLFKLAGEHELAKRIRPPRRRSAGAASETDDPAGEGAVPDPGEVPPEG